MRLPGGGGAPEIAASCRETFVLLTQSQRTFVEQLDFRSTVGFGDGIGSRELLGFSGAGVTAVITDLGVLEPDPETCELVLTSLHPGVDADTVRAATGWKLRVSDTLLEGAPPTGAELAALRGFTTMENGADGRTTRRGCRRDGVDPPYLHEEYVATRLRAPSRPLLLLPLALGGADGPGLRRLGPDRRRPRSDVPPRRATAGSADRRQRARARGGRAAGARLADRDLAGERGRALPARRPTATIRRSTRTSTAPGAA